MKKIKFIFGTMMLLLAGAATSCSDDPCNPVQAENTPQVYFSNENTLTYTLAADSQSISFDVLRVNTQGALSVPVTVSAADSATAALFNGNGSVAFADGAYKTAYALQFDRAKLGDGVTYVVTLTLNDPNVTTIYGLSKIDVTIKCPEPLVFIGNVTYTDDLVGPLFGAPPVTYEVEAYENANMPGFLLLKNAYTSEFPYNEPGDYVEDDVYFTIDISDPDAVVIPEQDLGVDWGYGMMYIYTTFEPGTLKNGIITFPPKGIAIADDDGAYYANNNGAFLVAMPGAVLADYSVEVTYSGIFHSAAGDYFAVAEVAGGEDVEQIEVGIGAGKNNADAVLEAILAGKIETQTVKGNSGTVQLPVDADGDYTIVAVSYGDGEPQDAAAVSFKFYAGEAPEEPEVDPLEADWTDSDIYSYGGIEKDVLFDTDWTLYARWFNKYDERVPMYYINFSESPVTDEYDSDYIEISGLSCGLLDDDTILWEYYEGFVLDYFDGEIVGKVDDDEYLGFREFSLADMKLYTGGWGFVGGPVAEGYIAFAPYDDYNVNGYAICAFDGKGTSLGQYAILYDLMLEDDGVATRAAATSNKLMTLNEFKGLAASLSTRTNYVETTRGYAHSKIDAFRASKKAAVKAVGETTAVYRGTAKAGMHEVKAVTTREKVASRL